MSLIFEREHGWVIITSMSTWVVAMWLGINVGRARKKYGVKVKKSNFVIVAEIKMIT